MTMGSPTRSSRSGGSAPTSCRSGRPPPRAARMQAEWTEDRLKENGFINRIRAQVVGWRATGGRGQRQRQGDCSSTGPTPSASGGSSSARSRRSRPRSTSPRSPRSAATLDRERAARASPRPANPGLFRIALQDGDGHRQDRRHGDAHRLATLNKVANPQDGRFSDAFLIVTPGITIRDRLRVLLPERPGQLLPQRDIVPADRIAERSARREDRHHQLPRLPAPREQASAPKLDQGDPGQATSRARSPRRPTRWSAASAASWAPSGTSSSSTTRPTTATAGEAATSDDRHESLTGDERREAEKRERRPASGSTGLEAVDAKIGVRVVYDLSATPFFLRGSGYPEGTLFPWVVSDFSLIDAIEAGIVKVPRVPVADDATPDDQPTYRDLWLRIRDDLPEEGPQDRRRRRQSRSCRPSCRGRSTASTATTRRRSGAGRRPRQRTDGLDAAGVHRRLQQHQRLEARLRLHRRLGEAAARTARPSSCPASSPLFSNVDGRPLVGRGRRRSWSTPAARIGRGDERRVQGDRRRARSRSSRPSTASASPAATPTTSPTRTCCAR